MNNRDWKSIIQCHLDGVTTREEVTKLSEQLESDTDTWLLYLQLARVPAALAADGFDESSIGESERRFLNLITRLDSVDRKCRTRRLVLSVVAAAATFASVYFLRPGTQPQIATITSVYGVIQFFDIRQKAGYLWQLFTRQKIIISLRERYLVSEAPEAKFLALQLMPSWEWVHDFRFSHSPWYKDWGWLLLLEGTNTAIDTLCAAHTDHPWLSSAMTCG